MADEFVDKRQGVEGLASGEQIHDFDERQTRMALRAEFGFASRPEISSDRDTLYGSAMVADELIAHLRRLEAPGLPGYERKFREVYHKPEPTVSDVPLPILERVYQDIKGRAKLVA